LIRDALSFWFPECVPQNEKVNTHQKNNMEKLIITPKTKIYDLLEAYPQLEEVLIAAAPEFKKLRNPVLRRTIARVTSIGQAAAVGGLNVEELVNRLRREAGQEEIGQIDDGGNKFNTARPDWYSDEEVVESLDIRVTLNRGEQPVHEVLGALKRLSYYEILEVVAPFVPAPLIDKATSLGYRHWLMKKGEGEFRVYFSLEVEE
jgi:hypothetical protein